MISSTVEDYLKAVLRIEDMNEKVRTSDVARHLSVADATVTDMLRKLQKAGLLEYKPYYGASLTAQGRQLALKILRRHRLIELFLHQVMGYGWEQVHDEAEKLEHVVSDLFVDRIDALLNHPDKDPHGEVIPDARGFRSLEANTCLTHAEPGKYIVRKVINDRPEFLAYLAKESIIPGTQFMFLEKAPFEGPLKLIILGKRAPQYIGLEAAKHIYVSLSAPVDPHVESNNRSRRPLESSAEDGETKTRSVARTRSQKDKRAVH